MAHNKLASRLRLEQQPKPKCVEQSPEERVGEVECECPVRWADNDRCYERAYDGVRG